MDITISDFLQSAGLAHLLQRMLEEEITVDILMQANDVELSGLTTKLADKIKLRCHLEKIRQKSSSSSSTVTVALPERQSILILGPNETLEGTPLEVRPTEPATTEPMPIQVPFVQVTPDVQPSTSTRQVRPVQSIEESLDLKEFSFSLDDEIDFFDNIQDDEIQEPEKTSESSLANILLKNTRGKLLLERAKQGQPLTSRDRCYIVSIIVETELQSLQKINQTIRKDVWQKWSDEIVKIFKGESKDLYYVPYHIVGGKVIQASGLIHNRLITHRRSLTEERTSKKRRANSEGSDSGCSSKSSSTNSTSKRVRPLPDEFQDLPNDASEETLEWLRGSSFPQEALMTKWRATFDLRSKILKETSYTEYFNSFPGLKLPHGYELLTADFEAVYPTANTTYIERFPLIKLKLLKLLADRAESSKSDNTISELLELASVGEEQANIAALLGIVALLRQQHTVTVPKKKLWRLSKEETRSGFLARVASSSEIFTYCPQREAFNISKGIPNQPYILAVGPSWDSIKVYEIVTTAEGIRYQVPNICEAIKVTYNLYWALDCAYPKVAAPCWMFIQRAIFQMKSKFDVEGVPLRELLLQLKSVNN